MNTRTEFEHTADCQYCGQIHRGSSRISENVARENAKWEVELCGRNAATRDYWDGYKRLMELD